MRFKLSFTAPAVVAISFCIIGGTSPAAADIIHVPGDFPTIQEAIDAAVNGDEIVVADGVYLGPNNRDLDFNAKLITLRSENGPDNCTINCQFEGRGFFFHSGETNEARVEGFTITNAISFSLGGGMFCIGSSPTVINCIFSTNQASAGGGMCNDFNSNPQITNCTFILNGANDGGAMFNRDHSSPVLTNCTFSFNSSDKGGGGMINITSSNPVLTNCTFIENSSGFAGGAIHNQQQSSLILNDCSFFDNTSQEDGGGVYIGSGTLTATNSIFSGNAAPGNSGWAGGGIYAGSAAVLLVNCLIVDNLAGEEGGGVYATGCEVTVTNCTFSNNSADEGAGLRLGNCEATVTNSILWGNIPDQILGNATVTYSCIQGGYKGEGNIDTDPMFVDSDNNDFHQAAGSPAIDAADNTAVPKGIDTDLDGNPRFVDDPDTKDTGFGDPPIVDMGAYEFQVTACPWDLDGNGSVGTSDLLALFAQWGTAGSADFDESGAVGTADLLILFANWGPCP